MRLDFPVISFIGAVFVLIPLPWHWRTRNVAIISVITWLFLCNLTRGINSIVWGDNVIVKYQVWCDITTKIEIGANVGLLASILCICIQLSRVASPSYVVPTAKVKRRRMLIEIGMCAGFPLIDMALHYVVQGQRYIIVEEYGCQPSTYVSIPSLFIISIPPLAFALVGSLFAANALRWFIIRREQFQTILRTSRSGLTWNRWVRLITLSVVEITFATGLALYVLVANIQIGLAPWTSWADVHYNWMFVPTIPKILIPEEDYRQQVVLWYFTIPLSSLIFFLFFGLGEDANAEYKRMYAWTKVNIFRMGSKEAPVLPVTDQDTMSTDESEKGASGTEPDIETAEVKRSNYTPPSANAPSRTSLPSLHEIQHVTYGHSRG